MFKSSAAVVFVLALCAGTGAFAVETPSIDQRLESVERSLVDERDKEEKLDQAARALSGEVGALQTEMVAAAARLQQFEERVARIEDRLTELALAAAIKRAQLDEQRDSLSAMLGALQRLSRQPPEALAATPVAIDDTIRTSLVLGAMVPLLSNRARSLGVELDGLASLHREIATERLELADAKNEIEVEQKRLAALHGEKLALQRATLEERGAAERRVAALAAQANSLRELLEKLSARPAPAPPAAKPAPADGVAEASPDSGGASLTVVRLGAAGSGDVRRSFSDARGSLPLPARGRIVGRFGQARDDGRSQGLTIETRSGAQVVTPYDGEVVFAGSFRGYGQLLIIEHSEGYHTLLAGFARIDSVLGQWLLAGEPVGAMGPGTNGKPELYVELRRNGEAINPLPWLAASYRKVNG